MGERFFSKLLHLYCFKSKTEKDVNKEVIATGAEQIDLINEHDNETTIKENLSVL